MGRIWPGDSARPTYHHWVATLLVAFAVGMALFASSADAQRGEHFIYVSGDGVTRAVDHREDVPPGVDSVRVAGPMPAHLRRGQERAERIRAEARAHQHARPSLPQRAPLPNVFDAQVRRQIQTDPATAARVAVRNITTIPIPPLWLSVVAVAVWLLFAFVLPGFAFQIMAERMGERASWLAWIPAVQGLYALHLGRSLVPSLALISMIVGGLVAANLELLPPLFVAVFIGVACLLLWFVQLRAVFVWCGRRDLSGAPAVVYLLSSVASLCLSGITMTTAIGATLLGLCIQVGALLYIALHDGTRGARPSLLAVPMTLLFGAGLLAFLYLGLPRLSEMLS